MAYRDFPMEWIIKLNQSALLYVERLLNMELAGVSV